MTEAPSAEAARRLAAFGIAGRMDEAKPIRVEESHATAFLSLVATQRLTGIGVAALQHERLDVPEGTREELLEQHRSQMIWALTVERRLLRVTSTLREAGIEPIVLKGSAIAHRYYPDPSWRPFADVDLLVRTKDWTDACEALRSAGYERQVPEPRPGFDRRFGVAPVFKADDGVEVDLHRTLVTGPFGVWIEPDELFARTETYRLAGVALTRFDASAALLHACMHAALGFHPPLLLPLRDVVEIAWEPGIGWHWLSETSREWRLHAVYRYAFSSAMSAFATTLPAPATALSSGEPDRRGRRALAAYTTSRRLRGGETRATLWAIKGIRAKAAYAVALLFPAPAFLKARTTTTGPRGYLRRWATPLRWIRARRRGAV